ncbi:hypothetical protein ACHHYP_00841 [Achlya hypogyna]|uniref:Transmembrane protein n=1 Tax=Achlya hypogyna TaxID=1202772 RepID=A0A1V9ZAD4_ACHHY|nr:hypothetical protein ACHHYP_00841 [Achlya hypogyna]
MFGTAKGLATLLLCVLATGFSWAQLFLPTWRVATKGVASVGLWGLCADGVCYPFFVPSSTAEVLASVHGNASRLAIPANATICSYGWNATSDVVDDPFIAATCGSIGHASMAMCLIQTVLGTLMCASYLLWTCATTNKSCLLALCKLLAFASLFANLLTITMWMVQKSQSTTGAAAKDGLGFIFTLVSASLFGLCVVFIGMLRLKEHHERMQTKRDLLAKAKSQLESQKSQPINMV